MLKTIKFYETPDMMVFEMHAEGVMCQSPYGKTGAAGTDIEDYDYVEDF